MVLLDSKKRALVLCLILVVSFVAIVSADDLPDGYSIDVNGNIITDEEARALDAERAVPSDLDGGYSIDVNGNIITDEEAMKLDAERVDVPSDMDDGYSLDIDGNIITDEEAMKLDAERADELLGDTTTENNIWFIILAIVAVIVIAFLVWFFVRKMKFSNRR